MKREILIVEDHLNLQKSLIDLLVRVYPEYKILATDNGKDAIDTAQARSPSLIIMDTHFPHIDVFEATRRIKAEHPEIPILIITDLDSELHWDYASSAGADACLTKDSIQTELIPLMNKLLKQGLKDYGDKGDV